MTFQVDIPIYRSHVLFLVESTVEEFKDVYDKNADMFDDGDYKSLTADIEDVGKCNGFVITAKNGLDYVAYIRYKDEVGDVAHELFHVVNKMLYSRGVALDENGEAWAYLISYLTDEFYNGLKAFGDDD